MIHIICALYPEAAPIIHHFHMKKDSSSHNFDVFVDPDNFIRLIISGSGAIHASCAVTFLSATYGVASCDFLLNFGSAAVFSANQIDSTIYVQHKITELSTSRTFYPDMIYQISFPESEIFTSPTVLSSHEIIRIIDKITPDFCLDSGLDSCHDSGPNSGSNSCHDSCLGSGSPSHVAKSCVPLLFDMEAAAIYQSGLFYYSPERMIFLKYPTDSGVSTTKKSSISFLTENELSSFFSLCSFLLQIPFSQTADWDYKKLETDFCCSATMSHSLQLLLRYVANTSLEIEDILNQMYQNQMLPCSNRKEGKIRLEYFKQQLLSSIL